LDDGEQLLRAAGEGRCLVTRDIGGIVEALAALAVLYEEGFASYMIMYLTAPLR
jgi:hypothetical protein